MKKNSKHNIAIIGMSCRLPGSNNPSEFWDNLKGGESLISEFSYKDLKRSGISEKLITNKNYIPKSGIINNIELFDYKFFNISKSEAEAMDPQHRLFLECCWEVLESAGYNPFNYVGLIGLFAGCGFPGYLLHLIRNPLMLEKLGTYKLNFLNDKDFLCTNVAHKLNLRGPAVSVQTACSTSLVAVHQACQSLKQGESDMVIAGGVSLAIPQEQGYLYQDGMIMSKDGCCRAFDEKATGIVPGNGCSVVLLKMLEFALEDGDNIYAVIKGSAINNDGNQKTAFSAPSVEGQKRVILEALEVSDTHPEAVQYIETHGTGTKLGDPIEIEALTQAYQVYTQNKQFCAIGSVKTNLGHTDTASGVTSLIKVALSLQHKQIVPSLHYESANSHIDFENSPFYVNTELVEWPQSTYNRTAAVSAFAIGGTNAHVLLEEAPLINMESNFESTFYIIPLSARNDAALDRMGKRLIDHLNAKPKESIKNVAYTLQVGRVVFNKRKIIICKDRRDLLLKLDRKDYFSPRIDLQKYALKAPDFLYKLHQLLEVHQEDLASQNYRRLYKVLLELLKMNGIPITIFNIKDVPAFDFFSILSALWLVGLEIRWTLLYPAGISPHRIPLPNYPFEKERCWVDVVLPEQKQETLLFPSQKAPQVIRKNLEQAVCELWANFFGIKRVDPSDDFFDLGGDSLGAVILIEAMHNRLGLQLDVHSFLEGATISELLAISIQNKKIPNGAFPPCIVPLHHGEYKKKPLFLVHPIGGAVYIYRNLVRTLAGDRAIFGIQAKNLDGQSEPLTNIIQMAKLYKESILSIQNEGPYYLGGASFGGVVAYEIAQQLRKAGRKVELLFMIDSPQPTEVRENGDPNVFLNKNIEIQLRNTYKFSEDVNEDIFLKTIEANYMALCGYQPLSFDGEVLYFVAKEPIIEHDTKNFAESWFEFVANEKLRIIRVSGNHYTMLEFPNVEKIGEVLNLQLNVRFA